MRRYFFKPAALLILIAVLTLTAYPAIGAENTDDDYSYYIENETAIIYKAKSDISGNIIIPSILGGYPVSAIGTGVFKSCQNLTGATIPDSVISIGNYAFSDCINLKQVTIPNSVTAVGRSAFAYCESLEQIALPNSITSIGNLAFSDCINLKQITLPNSAVSIGTYAFVGCTNLTQVTIPDKVTSIGIGAFSDCENLININVSDANQNYCSVDGNLFDKTKTTLVQYAIGKKATSYSVPDGIEYIMEAAFSECHLISVNIPATVEIIDAYAFSYCSKLISFNVSETNSTYCSVDGNLFNKTKKKLVQYAIGKKATAYSVPDSVIYIGKGAFSECRNLISIKIPNSVTRIGRGAFSSCSNLTDITLPIGLNGIDEDTFYFCPSLTSITIPEGVTAIQASAFEGCQNLKNIIIPESVTYIDENAFNFCRELKDIYYTGTMEEWYHLNFRSDESENITVHPSYPLIKALVTKNSEQTLFQITAKNIPTQSKIILALYKNKRLVGAESVNYNGEDITLITTLDYDTVKAMAWDGMNNLSPICATDIITQ